MRALYSQHIYMNVNVGSFFRLTFSVDSLLQYNERLQFSVLTLITFNVQRLMLTLHFNHKASYVFRLWSNTTHDPIGLVCLVFGFGKLFLLFVKFTICPFIHDDNNQSLFRCHFTLFACWPKLASQRLNNTTPNCILQIYMICTTRSLYVKYFSLTSLMTFASI